MAISSDTRKAGPFSGNGVTVAFPFAFKVFEEGDLLVVHADANDVETELVLGSDFTVELNFDQDNDPGGTVTMVTAPADGEKLTITSDVPARQPLVLTNNGGFYPRVINDAFDRITIIAQQLIEQMGRAIKLPISSTADPTLPEPQANAVLTWNSTGDGFTNVSLGDLATVSGYADARVEVYTGDGVETQFSVDFNPGVLANLDISVGGVTQTAGVDFTWAGTTVTFAEAPPNGATIQIRYARPIAPLPNYDDYLAANEQVLAFRDTLTGDESASLINTLASGAGAVARTVQSKLRDWRDARDYGAVADGTIQQAAVQALLDSTPARGSLPVTVPPGVKFDPAALTWPRRSHMLFFKENATTTPGYVAGGSGELVWWMQNSSYRAEGADGLGNDETGGEVNEVRFTSNFHPAVAVDVQHSVGDRTGYLGSGQDMTDPVRASWNILDDGNGIYRTAYENYLGYSTFSGVGNQGWFRRVRLTGIGTAQWSSPPAKGTLVTGTTSGARGHVVAVTAGYTDLELFDGRFAASETVSDGDETTAVAATITYAEVATVPVAVDPATGAWSVGDRPPKIGSEVWNVAGRIRVVPTRGTTFLQPKVVTKPAFLLGESEETGSPHALGLEYDPSEKSDATRRLRVVSQNSPSAEPTWVGELVPTSAMAVFGDAGIVDSNSTNVATITNSGTGLYDITYATALARAYGIWSCSVEGFYMPGWTASVTFVTTAGCQVRVFDATGALADIPAGAVVAFKMDGADV